MYQNHTVAAVLVAAGTSTRMGFDKLLHKIDGTEVLCRSVAAFDAHPYIDALVVVAGENMPAVRALLAAHPPGKPLCIVAGGATRTASVVAGVEAAQNAALVAIHDAARPFVSAEMIAKTVEAAAEMGAAAPALPVKDTIKMTQGCLVATTLPRSQLAAVQTPQVFRRAAFQKALATIPVAEYPHLTDDCMVMERAGKPVRLVAGEEANYKITTRADLPGAHETPGAQHTKEAGMAAHSAPFRIGHGYDVHRLVKGRPLVLGGVHIPHETGLLGHSDADVLAHAVCDALLGAAALGDLGAHFPDSDAQWKGADSIALLRQCTALANEAGYAVGNIDATLLCQAPKLAPHIGAMRANLAKAAGVPVGAVSVKATTEEGLGFTGRGVGIAAHCVALLAPR